MISLILRSKRGRVHHSVFELDARVHLEQCHEFRPTSVTYYQFKYNLYILSNMYRVEGKKQTGPAQLKDMSAYSTPVCLDEMQVHHIATTRNLNAITSSLIQCVRNIRRNNPSCNSF